MSPPQQRSQVIDRIQPGARHGRRHNALALLLAVFVGLVQLSSSPPRSKPVVPEPREFSQLITQLGHEEVEVRQEASQKLLERGLAVRPALLRALWKKDLPPETKRRIRGIADELLGFEVIDALEGVEDAWPRVGFSDRMFVIDNAWDFKRYRQILPKLPEVGFHKRQLLVVLSWDSRQRTILKPIPDGDTLVIPVQQQRVHRDRDFYRPPRFVVAQVVAWPGPIRFEVNGKPQFTVWKGEALEREAAAQLQEIKRLVAGGQPTMAQRVSASRPGWGEGTPDEMIAAHLEKMPLHKDELQSIFAMEFRRLADMRATPVVGDIFQLVENLKQFDPAFEGARHALSAIGGPEVVSGCDKTLLSKNHFAQQVAILVACDLGLEELRPLYHRALACAYAPVVRGGMNGLSRLGWTRRDVPALVDVLKRVDAFGDNADVVRMAILYLTSLGAEAAPALPALEKLKTHRIVYLREPAAKAIDKIRGP